jgi:hypothetical protein
MSIAVFTMQKVEESLAFKVAAHLRVERPKRFI